MLQNSHALSVGEHYREQLQRIAERPQLLSGTERAVVLAQIDQIFQYGERIFPPLELTGRGVILAHFLGRSEPKAMVDDGASPIIIRGLRGRRYADFVYLLSSQRVEAMKIMARRTEISYRSREWGIWLSQPWAYAQLWTALGRLSMQATKYRLGFAVDPTRNLDRLAALFSRPQPAIPAVEISDQPSL